MEDLASACHPPTVHGGPGGKPLAEGKSWTARIRAVAVDQREHVALIVGPGRSGAGPAEETARQNDGEREHRKAMEILEKLHDNAKGRWRD
jgi:hypothetical protein